MIKKIKVATILVSIAFMGWVFTDQWMQYRKLDWGFDPAYLFLSFFLLILIFFCDAFGWHLILRVLEQNITSFKSIQIWILSSITRYLPGGIWPYASRATLAREAGVPVAVSSVSLYLEMLLLISSSLAVGLPAFISLKQIQLRTEWVVILIFICIAVMHPKVILLLRFLPGKIGEKFAGLVLPGMKQLTVLYLFYIILWCCFGCVFVVFVQAFYPVNSELWLVVGSTLAFSFCVGFVIFFIPGGIGVRESAIYFFLTPHFPQDACILISIGSRLWIILGELFVLILVRLISYKNSNMKNIFKAD